MVLTTPVLRNLSRGMHDGAEIHYLTKARFRTVIEHNPYIAKIHTIERSTNEVIGALKAENFDYVIDLHRNLRSVRVRKALGVLDFVFKKYNFQKWLLVNLGINRMPDVHIVDRYMATLKAFGIENDGEGLDYFLPENGLPAAADLPETHRSGYVAVAIGAAHWRKRPREAWYIETCRRLALPVILLGGPDDREAGDRIAEACGERVWNAAGAFSLHGSAWLLRESRAVIAPDTGLMHIAAAFKKPLVSVWGATVPEFGMYPYLPGPNALRVQADHLTKRPCSKLGTRCKYKECRCIDELPLDDAAAAVNAWTGG